MEVSQIYALVNKATNETLGKDDIVAEDLSNLVDVGTAIMNANSIDRYVRSLVDHIGKVEFGGNRSYQGIAPKVLRSGWEYGAIREKIHAQLPQATENESWELQDGTSYDPNIFYKPEVAAKFFSKKTTWEIPLSFTEMQVRGSFSSASQMNGFLSMLHTSVENSKTIKTSDMIMRTINNAIAETFYNLNSGGTYTSGGVRCVNLLADYNARYNKNLTLAQCTTDPNFIRYSAYVMALYKSRLTHMSTQFNIGGQPRFTPASNLHTILLSEFAEASNVFLQSDTFHENFVKFPEAETVPFWQASNNTAGNAAPFAISTTSKIIVKPSSTPTTTVTADGILGVMFDTEALGVCNENQRVTTNYNPKAEFFTNWYKVDTSYFNDMNENFVVFYAKPAS